MERFKNENQLHGLNHRVTSLQELALVRTKYEETQFEVSHIQVLPTGKPKSKNTYHNHHPHRYPSRRAMWMESRSLLDQKTATQRVLVH